MNDVQVCGCQGRTDTTPGYRCVTCAGLQDHIRAETLRLWSVSTAALETQAQAMVTAGECICMDIVSGVVRPSSSFVHPHCPQHGSKSG